ncbi:hypothetical protein K474DRAFT_1566137, partial [Panus rudis PR-1116 ss-1]
CAICAASKHSKTPIHRCRAELMWNGQKARCKRSSEGRIVNPEGEVLCTDWQRPKGCPSHNPSHRHECS